MLDTRQSIIVPLDGSALAEAALPFGVAIAQRHDADLELVHVHPIGVMAQNAPMTDARWEDDRAEDMSEAVRVVGERLGRETGVHVNVTVLRGEPAALLMQHATDRSAALIAMTTHGRSGFSHAWFGSVTETVAHASTVPVLVVRTGEHAIAATAEPLFRHVLLPIEHRASGHAALAHALTLGTPGVTRYTLLTIVSSYRGPLPSPIGSVVLEELDPIARRRDDAHTLLEQIAVAAREQGADIAIRVVTADQIAPAILAEMESRADLIVLPTHMRTVMSRAALGSVADKVLRGSHVPVLTFSVS